MNIFQIAVNGNLEPERSHICQRWEPGKRQGKNFEICHKGRGSLDSVVDGGGDGVTSPSCPWTVAAGVRSPKSHDGIFRGKPC